MIKKNYNNLKKTAAIFVVSALALITTIYNALAAENTYPYGRGMMGYRDWDWGNMMGFGFGGGIIMLIFWIFIIWAGFAFFRWLTENQRNSDNASGRAMEILKEKYAKGEITKEEFETKKKDIM